MAQDQPFGSRSNFFSTVVKRAVRTNGLRDELAHKLLKIARGGFPGHDLHHLLPDLPDLAALSIGGLLNLQAEAALQSHLIADTMALTPDRKTFLSNWATS
jgi:hypothetical protein